MSGVPLEVTDKLVEEIIEWWREHTLVGYDVTNELDENAIWRYRPTSIEDAVTAVRLKRESRDPLQHDFGFEPTTEVNSPLFRRVLAALPEYGEEMARRVKEAVAHYREHGDMVG